MTSKRYVLKHFYYGQFVRGGQPAGDMRLLAKTHGLNDAAVKEALATALLPPMPNNNEGSWGMLRGRKTLPFLFVESERGAAGQQMLHYIVIPTEMMRQLGGNLRLLYPFIEGDMPAYEKVGNTLNPLVISELTPPDEDQEIDDILDFMMFTKNRMDTIESILAAVVMNVPVYVLNPPENPTDREIFVTGLLSLLPPSVRFAVTFAFHTHANTKVDAQIRFLADGPPPPDTFAFDWRSGQVSGRLIEHTYSRFIVSQLRLDAELVVRQTRALTNIASWRMKESNTRLAEALAYAAGRASIDDAVLNRQPVEAADVARILANDPTLSDELRDAYARHLMSFSVALGELEHAKPLGITLSTDESLADSAYDMLQQAQAGGNAGEVFDLMMTWLSEPLGPRGERWTTLLHESADAHLNQIIDAGRFAEIEPLLHRVDRAGGVVLASRLMPQLIRTVVPVAVASEELTHGVFLMACKHSPQDELAEILLNPGLLTHMPEAVRSFASAVQARRGVERRLLEAAGSFDSAQRLVMVRLVEISLAYKLYDMLDTLVLRQLVKVALAGWGGQYEAVLRGAAAILGEEERLLESPEENGKYLLSLLLAMRAYGDLTRLMRDLSRLRYVGDRQPEFSALVGSVFAETPIPAEEVPDALNALADGGIRSLPLALAYIGTLDAHEPSDITNDVADNVTEMLEHNPQVLEVLPIEAVVSLISYQLKRRHAAGVVRTAYMLPPIAARYGARTMAVIGKIYKQLTLNEDTRAARTEMLRRYVRQLAPSEARRAVDGLGRALGADVTTTLEATYAVKILMNDLWIEDYVVQLRHLAGFLHDTARAYASNRNTPSQGALLNELDSLQGGLQYDDKLQIARDIIATGRAACQLMEAHTQVRGWGENSRTEALLQGETDPKSTLEVMQVMGGFLSGGRRYDLKLETATQTAHPLPRRTTGRLLEEVAITRRLLAGMLAAYPEGNAPNLTADAIRMEMDSMWQTLPKDTQRSLLEDLARDLQSVAEIIPQAASSGDLRALEDTGLGRRLEENKVRPRNVIEFYRFTAGYYLLRA